MIELGAKPQLYAERALVLLMFCFGPLALYASRFLVALALVVLALALLAAGARLAQAFERAVVSNAAIGALLVLAAMGIGWADAPREVLDAWWRSAVVIGCAAALVPAFCALEATLGARVLDAASAGFGLLLALLLAEVATGGLQGSWIKGREESDLLFTSHAAAALTVCVWPLATWIALRRRMLGIALAAAALALVTALPLAAATLAFAVSACVWLLVARLGRPAVVAVAATLAVALLLAPLALEHASRPAPWLREQGVPSSWIHRLAIWEFYAERALSRPIFGHGLGQSKGLSSNAEASAHYARIAQRIGGEGLVVHPPLHPHNAPLQLWHDLGIVGVALALALLAGIARAIRDRPSGLAACATAQLTAFMVIASVSFGIWQKWWLAAAGLSAALCAVLLRVVDAPGDTRRA